MPTIRCCGGARSETLTFVVRFAVRAAVTRVDFLAAAGPLYLFLFSLNTPTRTNSRWLPLHGYHGKRIHDRSYYAHPCPRVIDPPLEWIRFEVCR